MSIRFFLCCYLSVLFISPTAAAFNSHSLDEKIQVILDNAQTPGAAVAIVKDGEVIYEKGFGVKNLRTKEPVTPHTIFGIASTTKAFTATLMAKLLEEELDDPIQNYFQAFKMDTEEATGKVTMADVLSHQTGFAAHFYLSWYPWTRSELFGRLKNLQTYAAPRESWLYSNNMYAVAGHIAESLTGESWEELIRERILIPLGMNDTIASLQERCRADSIATPYALNADHEIVETSCDEAIPNYMSPAGSIGSSAHDLAIWVKNHLTDYPLRNIGLSESTAANLLAPRREIDWVYESIIPSLSVPMLSDLRYGLGWIHQKYLGHEWIWHGGNIDGFFAHVGFIPDENIGVVVLHNGSYASSDLAIAYTIYDQLLGSEYNLDWSQGFPWPRDMFPKPEFETSVELPEAIFNYTGVFNNPGYGNVTIGQRGGSLFIHYGNLNEKLNHIGDNKFEYITNADAWMSGKSECTIHLEEQKAKYLDCEWDANLEPIRFSRIEEWTWTGIEVVGQKSFSRDEIIAQIPLELGMPYSQDLSLWNEWCSRLKETFDLYEAKCSAIRYADFQAFLTVDIVEKGDEERAIFRPAPTASIELANADILDIFTRLQNRLWELFGQGNPPAEYFENGYLDYSDEQMHALVLQLVEQVPSHWENIINVLENDEDVTKRMTASDLLNWAGNVEDFIKRVHTLLDDPNSGVRNQLSRFMGHWVADMSDTAALEDVVDSLLMQISRPSHGDRNKAVYSLLSIAHRHPDLRAKIADNRMFIEHIAESSVLYGLVETTVDRQL